MSNLIKLNNMHLKNGKQWGKNSDPQTTKIVGIWSEKDNAFLTQKDITTKMISEIEFHLKCVRNDVIDCEDFVTAIEQISAHYYAMNVELKN